MRSVLPELLDSLAPDSPEAQRSRSELRMINWLMGNHRWICRELGRTCRKSDRILELGAGDGGLARLAWSETVAEPARWSSLDLAPAPPKWPKDASWYQRDLFEGAELPQTEIVVANLFLHHFQSGQLAELGRRLPESCRMIIASEPVRHWVHRVQGQGLSVLARLSPVTRHDMLVSIDAGFMGEELPEALGLVGWKTVVSRTLLGAYRMRAWR